MEQVWIVLRSQPLAGYSFSPVDEPPVAFQLVRTLNLKTRWQACRPFESSAAQKGAVLTAAFPSFECKDATLQQCFCLDDVHMKVFW